MGPARAAAYQSAGLLRRRDLLYHLPSRYRVRPAPVTAAALRHGERAAVWGVVRRASLRRRGRHSTVTVRLTDADGAEIVVLLFNRAWLAGSLPRGSRLWAAGRVECPEEGPPRVLAADHERLEDAEGQAGPAPPERLLPIYRLPAGLPPAVHRAAVAAVLASEPPPEWRTPDADEPELAQALAQIHQPTDLATARRARLRLARDEALALSYEVAARRAESGPERGVALALDAEGEARVRSWLPHVPTAAQARALSEILQDLRGDRPMTRLLQGDVGSGKTLVAFAALWAAWVAGRQAALMAPTEVLARQHARGLIQGLAAALGPEAPPVALITGGLPAAERRTLREGLSSGAIPFAVGTQGMASPSWEFADLGLVVVDEQQRFGVRQRVRLRSKGPRSHLLVMTATPIPRTLALSAYGELDLSLLDELPPGRAPRRTVAVPPGRQPALWRHLAAEVAAGHRGYVVCPVIDGDPEESASVEALDLLVRERLGPAARVGVVHGRLPSELRDERLEQFRRGELDVLVATVLIEVGLDVPEATFVVIPEGSRFGLATLHQIRGRVGRGTASGTCFVLGPWEGEGWRQRLSAFCASEDGFALAEADLAQRGPGELLGTRQSGLPGFLVLDPVADVELLAAARQQVLDDAGSRTPAQWLALRERAFPRIERVDENLLAGG